MAPTTTTTNTPTTNALTSLSSISQILHLSYHRNKNQHRLAKWWGSLSQLKRQVQKLITELEALETAERFEVPGKGKGKKKKGRSKREGRDEREGKEGEERDEGKYVTATREKVEVRVEFLEKWLVPGCYLAFANLTADNQYAPLGLVLMATLARTRRVIRPFGKPLETSSFSPSPEDNTMATFGVDAENGDLSSGVAKVGEGVGDDHDLGEVVSRETLELGSGSREPAARSGDVGVGSRDLDEGGDGEEEDGEERARIKTPKKKRREAMDEDCVAAQESPAPTTTKRLKKKRNKGGDAFDNLFSSLI